MADRLPRLLLMTLFGAASLIALLAGCWTVQTAGVSMGVWGWMIGAWVFGLLLPLVLARGILNGAHEAGQLCRTSAHYETILPRWLSVERSPWC
ncbi:MAG: hypothetical protein BVN32_14115 [Proteobacteria bacterium ST_bin14]|nr:MAG: hypothetical protein BVN32_14115 [Proteobacteria bacterium ST_bin14]